METRVSFPWCYSFTS